MTREAGTDDGGEDCEVGAMARGGLKTLEPGRATGRR